MYNLYVCKKNNLQFKIDGFETKCFYPNPFKWMIKGEIFSRKKFTYISRVYYWIISKGKACIFYLEDLEGELVHTAYVIPKCSKFTFMSTYDYEIGPCFTYEKYRGQGIYGKMLKYISGYIGEDCTNFYVLVRPENKSSIKGMEKSGYKLCGQADKSKWLKIYKKI